MTEDRADSDPGPENNSQGDDSAVSPEFSELRELLLGGERRRLEGVEQRLDEMQLSTNELADRLPDAVALRTKQDRQLARSLAPTLQEAIGESVQRNPQQIAQAIFPILGPAIRKAIAETMAGFVNTLNRAIEHSLSFRGLRWRIEAWRTGVPYAQIVIKHALVYRVERVYLIHRETGLLLAHATAEDLTAQDADLISGMLTAIRDFVQDSFEGDGEDDGGLRTFSVGERTVLVEQGPRALLAAVVRGQHPPALLERLQATLETVHLHFALALAEFTGDSERFEATQPLLEECLETVLTTDRPATRGTAPRIAWAAVLIVAIVLTAFWTRSALRWGRAMDALENAPGIVLVDAERGLTRHAIVGLRDPSSGDPSLLLADHQVDTTRIDARWETYLSLDPEIIESRASHALRAPGSVGFRWQNDTLFAMGTATEIWMQDAAARATAVPGVTFLDLSGIDPVLPEDLAAGKRRIESLRVHFDIGSSILLPEARDVITEVAGYLRDFLAAAQQVGYDAHVQLVGRTDTTGSNETNQVLSQDRANVVRAALESLGMQRRDLTASGIGTTAPLPADDPEERAAHNRSVSFAVSVSYGASESEREQ